MRSLAKKKRVTKYQPLTTLSVAYSDRDPKYGLAGEQLIFWSEIQQLGFEWKNQSGRAQISQLM